MSSSLSFQTGSAYTGNGAPEFVRECFSRLPKRVWKVFVRADSGFFNGELINVLEEKKSEYLIKVKMRNLAKLLMQQKWQKVKGKKGVESADFQYQCEGWNQCRRFVAIRKLVDSSTTVKEWSRNKIPVFEINHFVL